MMKRALLTLTTALVHVNADHVYTKMSSLGLPKNDGQTVDDLSEQDTLSFNFQKIEESTSVKQYRILWALRILTDSAIDALMDGDPYNADDIMDVDFNVDGITLKRRFLDHFADEEAVLEFEINMHVKVEEDEKLEEGLLEPEE